MIEINQDILDKIQSWLSKTIEEFNGWEFDGDGVIILLNGRVIERYPFKEFKELINE